MWLVPFATSSCRKLSVPSKTLTRTSVSSQNLNKCMTRRTALLGLLLVPLAPYFASESLKAGGPAISKGHIGDNILMHLNNDAEHRNLATAPDHDSLFLRFIQAGGGFVPWLGFKWRLTRRFVDGDWSAGGGAIVFEPNPDPAQETITYSGPQPTSDPYLRWGVFEPPGGWRIVSSRPTIPVILKNSISNPNLWAIMFRGQYDFVVKDIEGWNCNAVRTTSSTEVYKEVVINYDRSRTNENCSADFKIVRCGAQYDEIFPAMRDGAVCCHFSRDGEIVGGRAVRAPHGFMYWGGDARTDAKGEGHLWANQRKCIRLTVRGLSSYDTQGSFCWGSMGQEIKFINCTGVKCGDVGFDFEGSLECLARGCQATDAANGNYSTFFHCDKILFEDCISISNDHSRPLFRMYNDSGSNSENRRITIRGGSWTNNDTSGIGSIDTRFGCCQLLEISGLSITDASIDTAFSNPHHTRIVNNKLKFNFRSAKPFSAIRAGFAKSLAGAGKSAPGKTEIIGNSIETGVDQPPNAVPFGTQSDYGTCGIDLVENDFNAAAESTIKANRVGSGFMTPILIRSWSKNPAVTPQVTCLDNTLGFHSGSNYHPIFITSDGVGINVPSVNAVDNRTEDGSLVPARKLDSEPLEPAQ